MLTDEDRIAARDGLAVLLWKAALTTDERDYLLRIDERLGDIETCQRCNGRGWVIPGEVVRS
jgi:hypothetical protein